MPEQLDFFGKPNPKTEKVDFSSIASLIENSDSVDLAFLDNSLDQNEITKEEYRELARKLLAKHEAIQEGLVRVSNELAESSEKDPLTGLANRRGWDKFLSNSVSRLMDRRHNRESDPDYILCFMMDMDSLKPINDVHGHSAGDRAIQVISERLLAEEKRGGLAARLGGDEFGLLQEHHGEISDEEAEEIRSRIEERINKNLSLISGDINYPLGISVGVSVLRKNDTETQKNTVEQAQKVLIEIADARLYAVKQERKARLLNE